MRSLYRFVQIAVVASLGFTMPAWAGSVSAAKSRVLQAQDYADKGQKDDAKDKLDEAEKFLDGLSDSEKAPIEKDIADLRAKIGATVDPEVSARIERNVGRFLSVAEGDADSSPQNASNELAQAVDALNADDAKKNLGSDAHQKLQARVDALQTKLKGSNMSEAAQRFADRIERNLRAANENSGNDTRFARTRLDEATSLLASDEAKQKLDAATIQRLQGSLADAEAKLGAVNKKDALDRATRLLNELDQHLTADPFKGTAPDQAYKVTEELQSLRSRAAYQLTRLPDGDSDRKAYENRLAAAQAKIDTYDAAWAAANAEAAIVNRWKFTAQGFEGWDGESYDPSGRAFEKPKLTKTEQAARQTKLFLAEKQTVDAGQKQSDLPKAAAAITEAQKTMAGAQAKLDATFNQWMDAAEKQPRPQGPNRFDIGAAADMARWVDDCLAGSQYKDADVARAKKLDQRWQDELAAIKQQHEEALRKMTADANEAWPKIASSIDAQDGFHPSDAASSKGKTFRFKRIRNRSGWDFDGRYDLVMWVDGQPVAGMYDPKIKRAFADVARQIGDSVDDHIDWEVIAVIEGKGMANQRYSTEVKDEHMDVLGKIEGTRPVECVVVRIIAVHAGPIAMSAN
jgi:hypothetical protein